MAPETVTANASETNEDGALEELRAAVRGEVVAPHDASYEAARALWNGMIDRRPAAILLATSTEDVAAAVRFAGAHELVVTARGGGHGVAGNALADGGLVVDLSGLTGVEVDPERRVARAGAGCRLGDLDAATQEHALATPLGVVSQTGIAGLTLSGGIGWLRRKHGLSADNVVSLEVVTADARVLTATADENESLFWALRGGGGGLGIVTAFEYRLHPVGPEVAVAFVLYPGETAVDVLRAVDGYTATARDEVAPLAFLGRVPHADPFPAETHGLPYVAVAAVYAGDADEGEAALAPLRAFGQPLVDLSGRMSYVEAQSLLDEDYPDGWHYYWKSVDLDALDDGALLSLVASAEAAPSQHSTIDLWLHGGEMGRVDPDSSAFGPRPRYLVGVEANWEPGDSDDANVAWARQAVADLRPFSTGGAYLNFPGFFEEGQELLRASFGERNYERLVALKKELDPGNLLGGPWAVPAPGLA
jgi:FAD/FMN-containing dehydrogenase